MRITRLLMGMPITVDIVDARDEHLHEVVFTYFDQVDRRFSTYKSDSEISQLNRGECHAVPFSDDMIEVLALAELTRDQTEGFFDIRRADGSIDPSGIVKGWAIKNAASIVAQHGVKHFYIDAGGDIQTSGRNAQGSDWSVGIRNPFNAEDIVKIVYPRGHGVATSGTYVRGQHIYDPFHRNLPITDIVSLTVIGPDVLEADRIATAAFAMGHDGAQFIESLPGFDAYVVNSTGRATLTSRFEEYCV